MRTKIEQDLGEILDDQWVRRLFYTPDDTNDVNTKHRVETLRYQTTANMSIGGSGIGNSRVLNPPPGINRFADTPRGFGGDGTGEGNGVHHHEMLEKPMDIVHFRPGVPRFNPLADFWTNSFNTEVIETIEYGWVKQTLNFVGEVLGFFITAPLQAVGFAWKTLRSLVLGPNANKYNFYYLSPAPFLFWKGLDDMMNTMAIKLGFTGNARHSDNKVGPDGTMVDDKTPEMEEILAMMPGVFSELDMTGGYRIDTITLGHRYNMMYQLRTDFLKAKSQELFNTTFESDKDYYNAMAQWEEVLLSSPEAYQNGKSVSGMLSDARKVLRDLNKFQSDQSRYEAIMGKTTWTGGAQERKSQLTATINEDGSVDSKVDQEVQKIVDVEPPQNGLEWGASAGLGEQYKSVAIGGLDFFSIAVDKVESGNISISNNVGPSGIESMFNGTVGAAKNAWFSAANGNVSDGIIGSTIEAGIGAGKAFVDGMINNVTGGIQSALFGGKAYIDISDTYQDSTTTMPTMTYTFTSDAISGHPISKLKMFLPVLALLRCAAPISAGPRSFMSPYLVAVTHKGRNVCSMGMITNFELDWGNEAGWDINDIPCQLKVSFTVTNLDKNFHIPLTGELTDVFNDDGSYEALTNILAGVSPTDLDRSWAFNMKTRWAKAVSRADRFFSASHWAVAAGAGTRSLFEGPISALGGYVDFRK